MKILITGPAASGKSTACEELKNIGYHTVDGDSLGRLVHKETGIVLQREQKPNSADDHIDNYSWQWNEAEIDSLLKESMTIFVCGTVGGIHQYYQKFDKVIYLKNSADVIENRLRARKKHQFGGSKYQRDWVLSMLDKSNKDAEIDKLQIVEGNKSIDEVVQDILDTTEHN